MMDAVDDDAHVLDRFTLHHFGHGGFDLPTDAALSSASLHQNHHSDHGFVVGGSEMASESLSLDHPHGYYGDTNLDSNLLDVNGGVMYDSSFPSLNMAADNVASELMNGSQATTVSVVDSVVSGLNSTSESKNFETERQNSSNSASPNDDKKSCTCKDCGKVFNSVWYLKQHAVKHSSERPFKCKYCHKTYRFRSNLYQHKCPLRDRASELASAAAANGKLPGDGSRKASSTATDSPNPSSESSSSAEIAAAVAAAGFTRTRKRRAWPPLTSPPTSGTSSANGGEKQYKAKVRKGNQPIPELAPDIPPASSAFKWDPNNRCAISVSSSADSPTSPSSLVQGSTMKPVNIITLTEEEVQKYLDRHKDKLHKCPKCKSFWPSREYLTRHMEWHNDDSSRFRCVHCSETFVDEHRYGIHKQNHSPSSLHLCLRCRGKFATRVALKKHARRCLLADTKNNGSVGGQAIPKSANGAVNGYKQALFIDPTPPPSPSPAAIENGSSIENHQETAAIDGGENDEANGDSMQSAPAQQISPPSSYSEEDGADTKGNKSSNGFGTETTNITQNGGLDPGIDGGGNANIIHAASSENGLNVSNGSVLVAAVSVDVSGNVGDRFVNEFSSSHNDSNGSRSNVPGNNLAPVNVSSIIGTDRFLATGGITGQFHDAHSDSDQFRRQTDDADADDWHERHNNAHNFDFWEAGGDANRGTELLTARPNAYGVGIESSRRLESTKTLAVADQQQYVHDSIEASTRADTLFVSELSLTPLEYFVVSENSSVQWMPLTMFALEEIFLNLASTKIFPEIGSPHLDQKQQYMDPLQATVSADMVQPKPETGETEEEIVISSGVAVARLTPIPDHDLLVAVGNDQGVPGSSQGRTDESENRPADGYRCAKCFSQFAKEEQYHGHWIKMHVLAPVRLFCDGCNRQFSRPGDKKRHESKCSLIAREKSADSTEPPPDDIEPQDGSDFEDD